MTPIVRSLLEQDLYKFTMQQVMLHQFPDAHARYDFACRNDSKYPLANLEEDINRELDHLCSLQFLDDEIDWLRKRRFFRTDYIEFLSLFRFRRKFITVQMSGDGLFIRAEGPQIHVMGFEIYVLYIVSELYMRRFDFESSLEEGKRRAHEKIRLLKDFGSRMAKRYPYEFFEYGLRRRHSAAMQDFVIELFASEIPEYFKGTSNCYLAKKLGLTPIGTMAHEYIYALSNRSLTSHLHRRLGNEAQRSVRQRTVRSSSPKTDSMHVDGQPVRKSSQSMECNKAINYTHSADAISTGLTLAMHDGVALL